MGSPPQQLWRFHDKMHQGSPALVLLWSDNMLISSNSIDEDFFQRTVKRRNHQSNGRRAREPNSKCCSDLGASLTNGLKMTSFRGGRHISNTLHGGHHEREEHRENRRRIEANRKGVRPQECHPLRATELLPCHIPGTHIVKVPFWSQNLSVCFKFGFGRVLGTLKNKSANTQPFNCKHYTLPLSMAGKTEHGFKCASTRGPFDICTLPLYDGLGLNMLKKELKGRRDKYFPPILH